MNKFLLCFICIIFLTSCTSKKEEVIEDVIVEKEPVEVEEKADISRNFDFKSSWIVFNNGGEIKQDVNIDTQIIEINNPGENIDTLGIFREGIGLIKHYSYTLSFDINSDIKRSVGIKILNDGGEVVFDEVVIANNHYSFEFINGFDSFWNGKLEIDLGNDGSENIYDVHRINISNLKLKTNEENGLVKINQVGYRTSDRKVFVAPYNVGDYFNVIDVNSNEIVYTGLIGGEKYYDGSKETLFYGDFTKLEKEGRYRIETQLILDSYEFVISDNIYEPLIKPALSMMTIQRSGIDLSKEVAGVFERKASHNSISTIYGGEDKHEVIGGWYDAGDYGRYAKTGLKAVMDLLISYQINPKLYDNLNVIDSNNGISDILDEARYELEWLLKMQNWTGGVYNKVVSENFVGIILPEDDESIMYILSESTNVTGFFSGVLAYASIIFRGIDDTFSDRCLQASVKANEYLDKNQEISDPKNPEEFNNGEYLDHSDIDERFFSNIALYTATREEKYLSKAKDIFHNNKDEIWGNNWKFVGYYGMFVYLIDENSQNDIEFYDELYSVIKDKTDFLSDVSGSDAYFITLMDNFVWGSNMDIANDANLLLMANYIKKNEYYVQAANDALAYILGRNSLNMSFVVGMGHNYPKNIHSRMSMVKKVPIDGAMVGGVDKLIEDPYTMQVFNENTPIAKRYVDNENSYSTNEIAIYWNSSLVCLLTSLSN